MKYVSDLRTCKPRDIEFLIATSYGDENLITAVLYRARDMEVCAADCYCSDSGIIENITWTMKSNKTGKFYIQVDEFNKNSAEKSVVQNINPRQALVHFEHAIIKFKEAKYTFNLITEEA